MPEARNTASFPILQFFEFDHLPPELRRISEPFAELAAEMAEALRTSGHGAEVSAGLRKLLEAKDCFVRAALA